MQRACYIICMLHLHERQPSLTLIKMPFTRKSRVIRDPFVLSINRLKSAQNAQAQFACGIVNRQPYRVLKHFIRFPRCMAAHSSRRIAPSEKKAILRDSYLLDVGYPTDQRLRETSRLEPRCGLRGASQRRQVAELS